MGSCFILVYIPNSWKTFRDIVQDTNIIRFKMNVYERSRLTIHYPAVLRKDFINWVICTTGILTCSLFWIMEKNHSSPSGYVREWAFDFCGS